MDQGVMAKMEYSTHFRDQELESHHRFLVIFSDIWIILSCCWKIESQTSIKIMRPFNCLRPVLTYHVNTLVYSVLLWSNKFNNNTEITPFIPILAGQNLHKSQTPSHKRRNGGTYKGPSYFRFFLYFRHSTRKTHLCLFWTLK